MRALVLISGGVFIHLQVITEEPHGHYGDPICSAYGASLAGVRALGMHGDYGGDGPGA